VSRQQLQLRGGYYQDWPSPLLLLLLLLLLLPDS